MVEIADLKLDIEPVKGQEHGRCWTVTVSYRVRFLDWETGSWIREVVELRGATRHADAPLLRLTHRPWKLAPIPGQSRDGNWHSILRCPPPQTVGSQVLDENPDQRALVLEQPTLSASLVQSVIFLARDLRLINEDKIFARVELHPCTVEHCSADSDLVTGQFGEQA
jgi:hypothetical protein